MKTIEVYKTNVDDKSKAQSILDEIRQTLPDSDPSIDLEDCDKVLRVENPTFGIDEPKIKKILIKHGYQIEILP